MLKAKEILVSATAIVVTATGSLLAIAPQAASATALGCTYSVGKVQNYCVGVYGSGDFVSEVQGSFGAISPVCNWDITAEFFNSANQWYRTLKSAVHYSCSVVNHDFIWPQFTAQNGYVCSTLQQNGAALISRCEGLHS